MNPSVVLAIDDDDAIRETLSTVLDLEGITVVAVASGTEGLAQLRGGLRPCLILLDLQMPGMSGASFFGILQQEPALADIPVVVFSGDRVAHPAGSLGAAEFLSKPVDLEALLQVVERHCLKHSHP